MARVLSALLIALLWLACSGDPIGKPCQVDSDCGPGFDCFPNVCVPVCTKTDECLPGQTCYRYHCVTPGPEQHARTQTTTVSPTAPTIPPPLPDATLAELRAIRRELELLRHEQAKLTAAFEEITKEAVNAHQAPAPNKKP